MKKKEKEKERENLNMKKKKKEKNITQIRLHHLSQINIKSMVVVKTRIDILKIILYF